MIELLLLPLRYDYMLKAIWVSGLVGAACAFLSAFLMLKGWSLMGDALSHSVVPGVAGAYALGLPYAAGAFLTGMLAAVAMALVRHLTRLREDAIIGFVFSTFFAAGLLIVSLNPTAVNIQSIVFGNILGIADEDVMQVQIIIGVTLLVLLCLWKDLLVVFFDEGHARTLGLSPLRLKLIFFTLFSACTVAALQTVGAILVIAMVITPGATAYLLTDRFPRLLLLAVLIGALTSAIGAWLSFYLDGATGGVIVSLQTLLFLLAFLFAPKHGLLGAWRARRRTQEKTGWNG
jgi:manganese/iron transport system permease protein